MKIKSEIIEETYNKLEIVAKEVDLYFNYDLINNGFIDYDEYSDHEFVEYLQDMNIEITLFEKNVRFLTSLKTENGSYDEGSTCSEQVWATVSKGESYRADNSIIRGTEYFVYFLPIYDGTGSIWGMAFAGTPRAKVDLIVNSTISLTLLIAAIFVALFVVIIILCGRKMNKSMTLAVASLSELATGEMNVATDHHSVISEFEQVIDATANLKERLTESVGGAKSSALDLNATVRRVDDLAQKSATDTNAIAKSMGELSITAQSLAETVQEANSYVMGMGEAITSITNMAETSASDAETMRDVNKQVADVISNVKTANEKTVDAIKQVGVLTNECKQVVEAIRSAADEITEIAEQTNLLALNASIESARAGEAGRGFAVVAENIKSLASESANSSEGISRRVSDIIDKVDECVRASSDAQTIMEKQNELVVEAGEAMDRLSSSVGSVVENIAVITDEAKRLDQSKVKVLSNISDLSAISEENAASSEQVLSSVDEVSGAIEGVRDESEKMRSLAVQLEGKMDFFKL